MSLNSSYSNNQSTSTENPVEVDAKNTAKEKITKLINTLGKTSVVVLAVSTVALTISIFLNDKEMKTLRREQMANEKALIRIDKSFNIKNIFTESAENFKNIKRAILDAEEVIEQKGAYVKVHNYESYLEGRGDIQKFYEMESQVIKGFRALANEAEKVYKEFKSPQATIAFMGIRKKMAVMSEAIAEIKSKNFGHQKLESLESSFQEAKKALEETKSNPLFKKQVDGFEKRIENPFETLTDDLRMLRNKNSFIVSETNSVLEFVARVSKVRELLNDRISILNANIQLHDEFAFNTFMQLGLVFAGFMILAFMRVFNNRSQIINASSYAEAKSDEEQKMEGQVIATPSSPFELQMAGNLSQFLMTNSKSCMAVTDRDDKVVWATESFYKLLGLDRAKSYNWRDLLSSHLIRTNNALAIENAVQIIGHGEKDYILNTKTANVGAEGLESLPSEYRLIEIAPIHHYRLEYQKMVDRMKTYREIPGLEVYEFGDLLSEVSTEIDYLINSVGLNLKFDTERPAYVAFKKDDVRRTIKSLFSGLTIYCHTKDAKRLKVAYRKNGEKVTLTFTIPGHKFKEVIRPLNFEEKTYPSLSSYLEQVEELLAKYHPMIEMRNVITDGNSEAVLTVELTECDDALLTYQSLEQRRRVARVVKVAEKASQNNTKVGNADSKSKSTKTGPQLNQVSLKAGGMAPSRANPSKIGARKATGSHNPRDFQ